MNTKVKDKVSAEFKMVMFIELSRVLDHGRTNFLFYQDYVCVNPSFTIQICTRWNRKILLWNNSLQVVF